MTLISFSLAVKPWIIRMANLITQWRDDEEESFSFGGKTSANHSRETPLSQLRTKFQSTYRPIRVEHRAPFAA